MLIEIRSIICEKQWWWLRYCYIATMSLENPQHNLFRRKITFALFTMKTTATAVPFHTAHSVNSNWINWVLTVVLRDSISIVVVVVVGVCSFTQLLFLFLFFLSAWHSLHPWSSTSSPTHYRFIIWHLWLFIMQLTMTWFSVINCPFWKSDNVNVYIEIRAGHRIWIHCTIPLESFNEIHKRCYQFTILWTNPLLCKILKKKIDYRIIPIDTVLSLPHAYFEIKHTVQHNSGPSNIPT